MATQKNITSSRISKIQDSRKLIPTVDELTLGILKSDKTALARAITLVESTKQENLEKANAIIENCLAKKTDSIRIGITGVPGVGKSTFIESFGKQLTSLGKKVAVLAVDPTSTETKGSILGDKTRMQELVKDEKAFIRPSPSGISLGGVTRKTRETIILCEAAGYDVILVETVGVGQSETAVHSMVDFFLLLKLPGAGDELQGIKRGIIEMADAIVINKADGDNVKRARNASIEFSRALHLYPPKVNGWTPKVLSCSSIENTGLDKIWEMILNYILENKASNFFNSKRQKQNKNWLLQTLDDQLKQQFYQDKKVAKALEKLIEDVINNRISPFRAAEKLLRAHHK
ncbi:methylmalonyl Co-A mutase-associated GTPase MeaB [Maribacter algarum]|uniref:Methylmalonyl Co-A mutase-associated GTPase MeaB n=1 Tax=Maribacter algarum (ex Zhang et al. 2020) TaxID=2578118 RepID=A0A5S3PM05_9FLAO|nr:methylmalonyl Co-A mutase-associated GTPase MeaB [Maribacter algarum]TMM53304.1 methylmalonyl Co-A mutase-associated GTPase MeaB [Maribacter algarum]